MEHIAPVIAPGIVFGRHMTKNSVHDCPFDFHMNSPSGESNPRSTPADRNSMNEVDGFLDIGLLFSRIPSHVITTA